VTIYVYQIFLGLALYMQPSSPELNLGENQMSGECNSHSNISNPERHNDDYAISRIRRIASALGISLAEINVCNTSLPELIGMAQRRSHHKPFLWAHLKAIYANVNVMPALSKLANSGNSSHISKIVAMVNSGASAITVDNYVKELIETQMPKISREQELLIKETKMRGQLITTG
jgi:hypothetical protein